MILEEIKRNVFEFAKQRVPLAHCIASDLKMGAGIAVEMQKRFGLRGKIIAMGRPLKHPRCIFVGNVYNLITKKRSSGKPTLDSLALALGEMRLQTDHYRHRHVAMPRIGCGLDRLSWPEVREVIRETWEGADITITVCRL